MDTTDCSLVGPGQKATGCRTLGGPGASSGSLVGGIRVSKNLELLLTHWQVKLDPGVSAGLLSGRAGSWSLAAGPSNPRVHFRLLSEEGAVPDTGGYVV